MRLVARVQPDTLRSSNSASTDPLQLDLKEGQKAGDRTENGGMEGKGNEERKREGRVMEADD